MIQTFKHKGLKRFFDKGDSSKLNQSHVEKIRTILLLLQRAKIINDMNFPGSNLHPYPNKKDTWSVDVSGNYRILFKFIKGDAYMVDYNDPH